MGILHRHILREVITATFVSMGLFVFVLLAGNALRDSDEWILAGSVDFIVMLKLVGLLIPYVAAYALPLGILTGTLIAYGRLSAQREIAAMKSAGVSMYQITAPVVFIAVIGMLVAMTVNLYYAPQARVAYKHLIAEVIREAPLNLIEERRFITAFPNHVIYMGDREGSELRDFWIWELDDERRVTLFVRAARGRLDFNEAELSLILTLHDGTAEQRDPRNPELFMDDPGRTGFFGEMVIGLPLDRLLNPGTQRRRLKEMTAGELLETRREMITAEQAGELGAVTSGGISLERLRVQMQVQNHFAMAYSVLSLALLGVPLAIQVGRRETYANMALALILAMTYYFLMIVIGWLEAAPAWRPDLLLWLPNIAFQALAIYGLRRAAQH